MKKILTVLFILVTSIISAQYNSLFKTDTTQWKVHFTNMDNVLLNYEVLNNKLYSDFSNSDFLDSIPIRKDSMNSKIWITPNSSNKEILIFDLNLAVNDSFKVYEYSSLLNMDSSYLIVDSVYYLSGNKTISFKNTDLKFIEGLGPNFFFLFGYTSEPLSLLICKTELGFVDYHIDEIYGYKNCEIFVGIQDLVNKENFSLNTVIDTKLRIETDLIGEVNAKIFNSLGEVISSFKFESLFEQDYSNLKCGIYFLKLTNGRNFLTIKILKRGQH